MRRVGVAIAYFLVVGAAPTQAADRLIIQDQAGQTEIVTIPAPSSPTPSPQPLTPGSINIYRPDGTRAGYGVQRPNGSTDLFRPDGSRLGSVDPGRPGQPGRITLQPGRRK